MIDKNSDNWKNLPFWLKCWFVLNFLELHPRRKAAKRVEILSHVTGFLLCGLGLLNTAALAGGLIMLANAYWFCLLNWQGDKHGIWYDTQDAVSN